MTSANLLSPHCMGPHKVPAAEQTDSGDGSGNGSGTGNGATSATLAATMAVAEASEKERGRQSQRQQRRRKVPTLAQYLQVSGVFLLFTFH